MARGLRGVRSVAFYYGGGFERTLQSFDLAVVDPSLFTSREILSVKEKGTKLVAYVSVLETPADEGTRAPENVLLVDGTPLKNERYRNWVLDPRHQETIKRTLDLADSALDKGYDGFFLDTVGDVEDLSLPARVRSEVLPAAAHLVRKVREHHPERLLLQNWGLQSLLPLTVSYLDGVVWENFPFRRIGIWPTLHPGIRRLQTYQNDLGLNVIALNGAIPTSERAESRDAAIRCGFLWYGTESYTVPPVWVDD